MSKNTLPMASTLMRACVVSEPGRVTTAEPLLGVLASSTVGNVTPRSVEREILTFAQLTGAALVLATSHVTVWVPNQATFVLGLVTRKGPAEGVTGRLTSCVLTPPPPARVSRAVTRRGSARAIARS